jgi:hypothetical protein
MTTKGAWIAATAFGFITAALAPQAMAGDKDAAADQIICDGINSCKGTGSCAGAGHACAGQNACKGQGHTKTTKKECLAKGGKVAEAKKDEPKKDAK